MAIKSTYRFTKKDLKEKAEKFNRWGKWGPHDEQGAMNFITPEMIANAAKLVKKGKVISLGLNFDQYGPQPPNGFGGRFNPMLRMLATGSDVEAGVQAGNLPYADDMIIMPIQCGTQWDALSHVFYENKMWNGYDAKLVDIHGASKNGIEKMKDKMVGRGVLLDIPRFYNLPWLENGMAITCEDLDKVAAAQGVSIGRGDILIIRTGQMERCLAENNWGNYARAEGPSPGISFETIDWIYEKEISALCADTWGVEVIPNEIEGIFEPCHWILIPMMGVTMGEIFNLKELALDCAQDGVYEFLFTGAPLPITNAVGSPLNPIAIK